MTQISLQNQTITLQRLPSTVAVGGAISQQPKVIAIGNFDGVHLGHQALIKRALMLAKQADCDAAVMLFEPQPLEFFSEHPPVRLMRLEEKVRAITSCGLTHFLVHGFDRALANWSPEEFAQHLADIGAVHLVVGEDFRYGHLAKGDVRTLASQGQSLRFEVDVVSAVVQGETRISSSRVRASLADGDIQKAAKLMGHPVSYWGRVGHGDKMGRELGFPTLNLMHKRKKLPLSGVYATTVTLADGRTLDSVTNIGVRPTVNGLQPRMEAHCFDFDEQIYGQKVKLTLHAYLRGEMKFSGIDALKAQVNEDIQSARAFLQSNRTTS